MRSKLLVMPVLAIAASLSAWAQAQKIAVIDMQGALLQTKDGQKAAAELKTKFGPKETEITKRGQDLTAKQEQYRKAAATMSEDAKAAAERDMQSQSKKLQNDADDAKADFQLEENKLLGAIMNRMQSVITKYANDNQLTMILDVSQQPNNLLWADQASNITAAIIALYDKSEATPTMTAPPAAKAPGTASPAPAVRRPPTPAPAPK